jgi:hypothetical protein
MNHYLFSPLEEKPKVDELTSLKNYFFKNEIMSVLSRGLDASPNTISGKYLSQSVNISGSEYAHHSISELFKESILQNNTCVFANIITKITDFGKKVTVQVPFGLRQMPEPPHDFFWFSVQVGRIDYVCKLAVSVYHRNEFMTKILIKKGFIPSFDIAKQQGAVNHHFNGILMVNEYDKMFPTYKNFSPDVNFLLDCGFNFNNLTYYDFHNFTSLLDKQVFDKLIKCIDHKMFKYDEWVDIINNILTGAFYEGLPRKMSTRQTLKYLFENLKPERNETDREYTNMILSGQTKISKVIHLHIKPTETKMSFIKNIKRACTKQILKPTSLKMQIFGSVF